MRISDFYKCYPFHLGVVSDVTLYTQATSLTDGAAHRLVFMVRVFPKMNLVTPHYTCEILRIKFKVKW